MMKTQQLKTSTKEQASPLDSDPPAEALAPLGDYAYQAIQKHFKKSTKHKTVVLEDQDPEPLHQMRVGMRRLRTVLEVFEPVLALPKSASKNHIKKIAKSLGKVRDADVLKAELETRYRPNLEEGEQRKLDLILEKLQKQRQRYFSQLEKTLNSSRYEKLRKAFKSWLEQPDYHPLAQLTLLKALPDLLLPLISQLLLHPGWLVGTSVEEGTLQPTPEITLDTLTEQLNSQGDQLHDLRKQMKRVRYQTEFFVDFYGTAYKNQTEDFRAIQELLGQLQDSVVLSQFLADELGEDWETQLPTLAQQIRQEQFGVWQSWKPIQQRYLDPEFRKTLRQQIMTPTESEPAQLH